MKAKQKKADLINRTSIKVRFSEVDSMQIVWHGEYLRYLEDGREAFGKQYGGLDYMDIYNNGYMTPLVNVNIDYKTPLRCGEKAIVETRYLNSRAAKILFEYTIFRESDMKVVAVASSVQVFLDLKFDLQLVSPAFYLEWKEKWGVIV